MKAVLPYEAGRIVKPQLMIMQMPRKADDWISDSFGESFRRVFLYMLHKSDINFDLPESR